MCHPDSQAQSDARVYAVHVRFETHPAQRKPVEWTEPPLGLGRYHGGYEVIGQSTDLKGLVRWVLSFGAGVEVLGPQVLRRRVAEEAQRVARLHADKTNTTDDEGG